MWWYHVDPPCFNKKSRALIQKKTTMINNNSNNDFRCCLKHLQASLYAITFLAKEKYYHKIVKKLKNIQEISEVYWSLLKVSLNNKKTAFIPPLFHENLILNISKFFKKKKKNSKQCYQILSNSSFWCQLYDYSFYNYIFSRSYWKHNLKFWFKQILWTW